MAHADLNTLATIADVVTAGPEHMGFVMDNWLNDWRTSKYAGVLRNCDYYEATRTLIEDLIARGAKLLVAEHKSFLGFICYELKDDKAVIHYRYVKDAFRRQGVEQLLLDAVPAKSGWFTFYDADLAKNRDWKHAPEIARRKSL
jgi:ribosomal protein S18 acetylase RimI-like enzyme